MLGGKLVLQRLVLVFQRGGWFLLFQDADRGLGPITATSASGHANTSVAPSAREFIAM
jgi:hypothetical protein